jgi:hypothetical protein
MGAAKSPEVNLESYMEQEACNLPHTQSGDGTSGVFEEAEPAEKAEFVPQSGSKKEGTAEEEIEVDDDDDNEKKSGSSNGKAIVYV